MSTSNIIAKGFQLNGSYYVTFSINRNTDERTYYYDARAGAAIENGADPAAFPAQGDDGGGAGGTGKRTIEAFKRAKGILDEAVEAAGTDVSALRTAGQTFTEAVAGLSDEVIAAGAALL